MSHDEVVTCEEVMRWLPADVRESLTMALPPQLRGWMTEEEAMDYPGRYVEVTSMSDSRSRFIPTDGW